MARDHFAQITTPYGSVVTLTGLTKKEAAEVARDATSDRPVPRSDRPARGDAETRQCTNCQGRGGWMEKVETTTPSGSTVVTQKWVNCRPCKGMGTVTVRS
jgi:hypothetical protein